MSVIIGIDNGISGGLVAISRADGLIVGKIPMPIIMHRDKEEPDIAKIISFVALFDSASLMVAIEEPLKHAKSSQAVRSMALCFGLIDGALRARGFDVVRIQVEEWQKAVLGRMPAGATKLFALARAKLLWPDEEWLASPRCRVPHDGMIDAALIAHYHRTRTP
jgi:hypothetical protein